MRALFLAALLTLTATAALSADTPKAIDDALKVLEKGLAEAKDAGEQEKLREAIAALKKVVAARKIQNELISDFVDNREKYVGRTLTFRLTYTGAPALNQLKPGSPATFTGEDTKNGTKLSLKAYLPRGAKLELPAVKDAEEVVLTFSVADKATVLIEAATRP